MKGHLCSNRATERLNRYSPQGSTATNIFFVQTAIANAARPANKTTPYSIPPHSSNKAPYSALPYDDTEPGFCYFREHNVELDILDEDRELLKNTVDFISFSYYSSSRATAELKKRYGFIYVDRNDDGSGTMERYKKKSFYWYRDVIDSNGESLHSEND